MSSISESTVTPDNPGLRTYRRDDCVVFHKTREAFGGLSNMATGFPILVSGVHILTTEALYQACRFPHLPKIQELIIEQTSPMTAKMKSKPHRKNSREDWESVKVGIMKWCLKIKLVQHWDRFGELLLSTAAKQIVELSRRDQFWGATLDKSGKTLEGSNVLGRLLMDIRDRLKKNPDEFSIVQPLPLLDFCILGRPIEKVERSTIELFDEDINQKELKLGHR